MSIDIFELGFSTLFLNRTNISGILDAGVIGGLNQTGKYKIDCRFNKATIISRILHIAEHARNIDLYNLDAIDLIDKIQSAPKDQSTIFYFDPPYYLKGPSLYLNHYKHDDHLRVSKKIDTIKNSQWIVSYDNTQPINDMYSKFNKKIFALWHTAKRARRGEEIMFFSDKLKIPNLAI